MFWFPVPSQPRDLRAADIGETSVTLAWSKPTHSGENIISYELYWNDTYAKVSSIYFIILINLFFNFNLIYLVC